MVAAVAALAGCTGGAGGVDPASGNEFRFTVGTEKGSVIPVADRRKAPPLTAPALTGRGTFDVGSLRGKVVVLNFWASWCAPCRVEAPEFDRAYRAAKAAGVEFVGVATKDDQGAARAFVKRYDISYPNVFDPTGEVTLRFRGMAPRTFPYTIVLDRQGRVAAVYPLPLLREDIEPVVRRLAAER